MGKLFLLKQVIYKRKYKFSVEQVKNYKSFKKMFGIIIFQMLKKLKLGLILSQN
jgi:hypothetical protein